MNLAPRVVLSRIDNLRLWLTIATVLVVIGLAAALGVVGSPYVLVLLIALEGGAVLLKYPLLGLLGVVVAALIVPLEFGTGSAVAVNLVTLLIPALLGLWLLDMVRRREVRLVPSRTNQPLLLFLLAGLFSLLIGNALWDPAVPRGSNFIIVQLAQWAVFLFSAGAYWLLGNLVPTETWLRRLTFLFLGIGGSLAILYVVPVTSQLAERIATYALLRPPFWALLSALAAGQIFFNRDLSTPWRLFLLVTLGATLDYAFVIWRVTASNWIGVGAVLGILAWLRFPRLRWSVIILLLVLAGSGLLSSTVYDFAGGDAEWEESGGSRMALISRVVEVTMRNPVTGLGPASYRPYAAMNPLPYGRAFWIAPQINSHNNYVDLFAHVGLFGLAIFFWFAAEVTWLGFRLRRTFKEGFAAGYLNAVIAAWVGALILMLFADWMLPFVYNIGFSGFQASVLVWLFMGGLLTLEQIARHEVVAG